MTFDQHMMEVALAMARQGLGTTWPNPSVGAVIADEKTGEVIARGYTMAGGRPHAETQAIKAAGSRARDKTLYVTLEPCSHTGQTPPCADAIIKAGISRVVVSLTDPNPRVQGRGINRLKNAGVQVTTGLAHEQARKIALGHILRVSERRPFVQLKLALDARGNVARGTGGKPTWVTGPFSRAHGHMLRAKADAILIGSGTLIDDNPDLTCRLPGLAHTSPVRVVLGTPDLLNTRTKLLECAPEIPVWLATDQSAHNETRSNRAFEVIEVPMVDQKVWLPALAEALIERGITRLLVEGGPTLWKAFAKAGLVDEVVVFIARAAGQSTIARSGIKTDWGQPKALSGLDDLLPGLNLSLKDVRALGDDAMFTFQAI